MNTKQTLRGLIAATLAGIAFGATAQSAQPPAGLKWQMMHDAIFNANMFTATATEQENALLAKIWNKEIEASGIMNDGSRYASFAVIGDIEYQDTKIILTMFNSHNSNCIQPGNGSGMVDMYSTCPLRIIKFFGDSKNTEQNLPVNFCMLYGDDPNNSRAKNHIEYGFDKRSGIVYLRTIQYGKVVPACNRALRVFKV